MDVKELRIGNWAFVNVNMPTDGPLQKSYITANHISEIDKGELVYCGIPINNEWLLHFGFIYFQELGIEAWYCTQDTKMPLRIYKGTDSLFRHNGSFVEIQYVHQLQNLYFALTNQELILNETH